MSKVLNKVVEIGTFGLVDDITGVEAGEKAALQAGEIQAESAQAGIEESRRQFDVTSKKLSAADRFNRQQVGLGRDAALADLDAAQLAQQQRLGQFERGGIAAQQQQQALLGLGGQQQQQDAFNQFADSPGQRFIRERAQKALLRNSSAIGGLGGGNVRSALVEQGAGFAAQDFGNQFNRLSDLRVSGQNAATNIGQGLLSTGANRASTQFGAGQQIGAGAINTAARQGQFGAANAANIQQGLQAQGEARASGILGGQQAHAQSNQGIFQLGGALLGGL